MVNFSVHSGHFILLMALSFHFQLHGALKSYIIL